MHTSRAMAMIALVAVLISAHAAGAREPAKPRSSNPEAQAHIDKARDAVDDKMTTATLDKAILHLEKARAKDPDNAALLVELANTYFYRGHLMPGESDSQIEARRPYFEKCHAAASESLSIKETAGAHYWTGACLGSKNEDAGVLTQASLFPEVIEHIEWIEAHDKSYSYGMQARFWVGVLTRSSSMVVKMVGRDTETIMKDLETAIANNPRYIENYVMKAELLMYLGQKDQAVALLEKALAMDPAAMSSEVARNRMAQDRARLLYKQWTGKPYPG